MIMLTKKGEVFFTPFLINICGKNTYIFDSQFYMFYFEYNVYKRFYVKFVNFYAQKLKSSLI